MENGTDKKTLSELTDSEVTDILSGASTHPMLNSPMADAAAGYLMYRMVKPVLKLIVTRAIPFVVASGIAGAGAFYGHDWFVENTEVGAKM
ncbi:hypothetical protein KY359_00730, partial [Candidatus Woesearchaeota archaeon]|nr:hypothetical protein [Candidatus Woesearchaeota archaeon]